MPGRDPRHSNGTPADVSIRRAATTDAPTLAALRLALRQDVAPMREDAEQFLARCEAWMVPRLSRDESRWSCWVAVDGGCIVGQIWLAVFEKIPNPGDASGLHAYITNFFVRPEWRSRGIGDRLLAEAIGSLKDGPIGSCILWATEESRSLYARHGFAASPIVMERGMSRTLAE